MSTMRFPRFSTGLAVFIVLVICACGTASAQTTHKRLGNWITDRDACSITARFRNGQALTVTASTGAGLLLSFGSNRWNLAARYSKTILYWAGDDDPQRAIARAQTTSTVSIAVSDPTWIMTILQSSRDVTFAFDKKIYRIPITHGPRAAGWLMNCSGLSANQLADSKTASRLSAIAESSRNRSGAPRWTTAGIPTEGRAHFAAQETDRITISARKLADSLVRGADSIKFLIKVLDAAGVKDFTVDTPKPGNTWPIATNIEWRGEMMHGAIRRYRSMTTDQEYLERRRIAYHDTNRCAGRSNVMRPFPRSGQITGLVTACAGANGRTVGSGRVYVIAEANNGDSFLMMLEQSSSDPTFLEDTAVRFAGAARSIASGWN